MDRKMRLLIVEDEEGIIETLEELFEDYYEVALARNGQEALTIIPEFHPQVILSDVNMPKMGGMELYRKVNGDFPEIKFIFMTGKKVNATVLREIGMRWVLDKPSDIETAKRVVAEAMEEA